MSAMRKAGPASFHEGEGWHAIDWQKAETNVRGLQVRIAKATREGDWRRVKTLQRFLTRSYAARCLAVRRVTENRGRDTPGVDRETWSTPTAKYGAVARLVRRGYKPKPLRRVYIPKANGKKRPLGIPTMLDRAMQALHSLGLVPVAETTGDRNSYGFRPHRATADAAAQCFNIFRRRDRGTGWVLEGDIEGCFDNISHDWLLAHVPMDKGLLRKWLKAGVVDMGTLRPTKAGTPQGGIISPVLANLALDGLEGKLTATFGRAGSERASRYRVNLVRYADDFIVTGSSDELLSWEVLPLVSDFLAERGLSLSVEKTRITHVDHGFDFLGWNIRKYAGKILIKPSRRNVQAYLAKIREIVRSNRAATQLHLIWQLNPVIRGWSDYHRGQVSKAVYTKTDHIVWRMLWRWARRRHGNKHRRWVKDRYFRSIGSRNWVFAADWVKDDGSKVVVKLLQAADTAIVRHVKVRSDANPFDPACDAYFDKRRIQRMLTAKRHKQPFATLFAKQKGLCASCGQTITTETGWHVHHVVQRKDGGGDDVANLVLLHPVCHVQNHHGPKSHSTLALRREGFVEA